MTGWNLFCISVFYTITGLFLFELFFNWFPKYLSHRKKIKIIKYKIEKIKDKIEEENLSPFNTLESVIDVIEEIKNESSILRIKAMICQGLIYLQCGELRNSKDYFPKAEDCFNEALIIGKLNVKKIIKFRYLFSSKFNLYISIMNNLSILYLYISQIQMENMYIEKSNENFNKISKYKKKIHFLSKLSSEIGKLKIEIQKINNVNDLLLLRVRFNKIFDECQKESDNHKVALVLFNYGELYEKCAKLENNSELKKNYYELAEKKYHEALKITRVDSQTNLYGKILHGLGNLFSSKYTFLKDADSYNKALKFYENELKIYKKEKYPYPFSIAKEAIAHLHLKYAINNGKGTLDIFSEIVISLEELLSIETLDERPIPYASICLSLGDTYRIWASFLPVKDEKILRQALQYYEYAQIIYNKEDYPEKNNEIEKMKKIINS